MTLLSSANRRFAVINAAGECAFFFFFLVRGVTGDAPTEGLAAKLVSNTRCIICSERETSRTVTLKLVSIMMTGLPESPGGSSRVVPLVTGIFRGGDWDVVCFSLKIQAFRK